MATFIIALIALDVVMDYASGVRPAREPKNETKIEEADRMISDGSGDAVRVYFKR